MKNLDTTIEISENWARNKKMTINVKKSKMQITKGKKGFCTSKKKWSKLLDLGEKKCQNFLSLLFEFEKKSQYFQKKGAGS